MTPSTRGAASQANSTISSPTWELKPGYTASFQKGATSVWTVVESVEKFFIVNV